MKKQLIIAAALSTSLIWTGCGKDFLERLPEGKIEEGTFWKTEKDALNALNAVYGHMGAASDGIAVLMDNENSYYDDGATDNAVAQYPWESNATAVAQGAVTTSTNDGWATAYQGIRKANAVLDNIDKVKMADDLKERCKAEARFLRAFFYGNLICKFGDVQLITKVLATPEEALTARDNKDKVWQFVFQELADVVKVLPERYSSSSDIGRATKGAALAISSRFHLFKNDWQGALNDAQQVMQIPGYRLYKADAESADDKLDDYKRLVDFKDAADENKFRLGLRSYEKLFWAVNNNNSEVIFDRQHVKMKVTWYVNTYLLSDDLGGWSSVAPTQDLVDAYQSYVTGDNITPLATATRKQYYDAWTKNRKPADSIAYVAEYRNRDPRFYASVLFESAEWNGVKQGYKFFWQKGGNNTSPTGYNFRKFVDPESWKAQIDNFANHVIIRYAEVLLTYAEAKNELSGPDASVFDAVNKVRDRAGMPALDPAKYGTKDAMRAAIRQERRIELALEGQRYMDIRRWNIADKVMKDVLDPAGVVAQPRTWNARLMLLPVPQSEIDLNSKLNPNNPGY